jgi:hypothetical protein
VASAPVWASNSETERVIAPVAPDALAFANALGDRSRAFRACRLALDCLYALDAAAVTFRPEYLRWAELAQGYASAESIDRLYADLARIQALVLVN